MLHMYALLAWSLCDRDQGVEAGSTARMACNNLRKGQVAQQNAQQTTFVQRSTQAWPRPRET